MSCLQAAATTAGSATVLHNGIHVQPTWQQC